MTTKLVREQIVGFLKSPKAEVLCVRGNWGTGKTYTWNDVLGSVASDTSVSTTWDKYAYTSLFGLNTVEEVKREIVTQTIARKRIGMPFSPDDVGSIYDEGVSLLKKNAGPLAKLWEGYYAAAMSIATALIRDRLVCIDDLERKGEQLRSADILGLISNLKEDRNCKVVLLLNDEQLEDRSEFEGYLEKVVDINVRFAPTPSECAEIALKDVQGTPALREYVRSRATQLAIDNVRVIRKLHRFVLMIEPLLKGYKPDVHKSVASSIVLLGWCHLQPETAPSMDFMIKRKGIFADYLDQQDGALDPKEKSWQKLLQDYGYTHTDEFDIVLLKGVQDGYFKQEDITAHAEELNLRVETGEAKDALHKAWRRLLDTFTLPVDGCLEEFKACFEKYAGFYSLQDVISVVNICRDFGRQEMSNQLFDLYVEANKEVKDAFDSHDVVMFGNRLPEDIEQKLLDLQQQQAPVHATDELFLMLETNGYDQAVTERLAEVPVAEYVSVLRRFEGEQFLSVRRALTQYNNLANPTDAIVTIMCHAGEALKHLANESPESAVRATGWGLIQRLPQPGPAVEDDA